MGTVTASNTLNVIRSFTANSNTILVGPVTASNTLNVLGSFTANSNITLIGQVTASNTLNVLGSFTANSNVTLVGLVTASNTLNVLRSLTVNSNTTLVGPVAASNTLNVVGSFTAHSDLSCLGTVNVSGMTTFQSNVNVMGNANCSALYTSNVLLGTNDNSVPMNVVLTDASNTSAMFSGNVVAKRYNVVSDRRAKTEIQDVDVSSVVNMIENINVRSFHYIDDSRVPRIGFIAQELEPYSSTQNPIQSNPTQLTHTFQ